MNRVEKIWQELSAQPQEVELAKADDILRGVSSLATLFLNSRNQLQNAGFDALQDYDKV